MKYINLIALLIALLITQALFGQTKISGIVLSKNGDTITGANVYIKDAFDGASSDANGKFLFSTNETGNKILVVSMVGYENFQKEVVVNGTAINLKILLNEKANELNTAVITAGTFEAGDAKKMAVLNSIDVATTAGATADIMGSLKTLPGTQPASEADGMFVRGGDASETKTFFDGMLVQNVFTSDLPDIAQRGRFSPFMFKGTSFSAGAYSAQYGDALSSTLILDSKDVAPKTKSGIDIMSVGLSGNHTHHFKSSSLELNSGYYNLKPIFEIVKQNTQWTKAPEQFNTNASYKIQTPNKGLLKVYADYSHTRVGIITDDINDITRTVSYNIASNNVLINSTYVQYLNDSWKLNTGIGLSNDDNKIGIDEDAAHQNEKALHARATITHYYGKLSDVKAGVEFFNSVFGESYNERFHELKKTSSAAFIESDFYFTNKLVARAGVRSEYADVISNTNIAPRISLAYKMNNNSQASIAYGKFYQVPVDEYLFESISLNFENATHYIANYQYQNDDQTFRVEAYYKKYNELVKYPSQENNSLNNSGYGYAKGIDFFWRDKKTWKRSDYWISYSYLDTKRDYLNYPEAATPTFAAKHVLNVVYKYMIPKWNTYVGTTFTFASGRPYYNPNNSDFLADKTKAYYNFSMNVSYLTSIAKHFTIVY
ncbi:MAG: TonB-dependent receptor, partial [Bacteroidia bacterium]